MMVDLDEDLQDFIENSELEVDGGVDCGSSPYPVCTPPILF